MEESEVRHITSHVCTSQVKWIFSSVVQVKQTMVPDYRNMIGQGA